MTFWCLVKRGLPMIKLSRQHFSDWGKKTPDPQEDQVLICTNHTTPTNASEVYGLLGMANYSIRFIKNFAYCWGNLTAGLRLKSTRGLSMRWTSDVVMTYFDPHKLTELVVGLWAVLAQRNGPNIPAKVIKYASRALSPIKQKYKQNMKLLPLCGTMNIFHMFKEHPLPLIDFQQPQNQESKILQSTSATATIPKLNKIFSTLGIPLEIKTHNGPPFQSSEYADFAAHLGFWHRNLTPLLPNAKAERFMHITTWNGFMCRPCWRPSIETDFVCIPLQLPSRASLLDWNGSCWCAVWQATQDHAAWISSFFLVSHWCKATTSRYDSKDQDETQCWHVALELCIDKNPVIQYISGYRGYD